MDSFLRRFVDFEAVPDSGADPEFGNEPEAPLAPAAPTEQPEAWGGPSQEEWQSLTTFQQQAMPVLQSLAEILSAPDPYAGQPQPQHQPNYYQPQGGGEPQFGADEFDPFDQNAIASLVDQRVQATLQQTLGPIEGLMGVVASEKGEQLARAELETIRGEVGEFDNDTAFLIASGMIESGTPPEQALRQAAGYAQQYEQKIRADERAKVEQELQTLRGAPRETPIGGASATEGVPVPTGPNRYEDAIRNALARRSPALP